MTKNINFIPKLRVLILDDESDYRDHYSKWVSDIGFSPMPIDNLSDAQKAIESGEIDIAIVDLFLGERSDKAPPKGLLLIRDIVEFNNRNSNSLYIIVVTGDLRTTPGIMAEIAQYMNRGIVKAFLSKAELDRGALQIALKTAGEKIEHIASAPDLDNSSDSNTSRLLHVFLCHSSNDKIPVRELYKWLNVEEGIDPWLDEEKLLPGQDWDFEIEEALRMADVIVVCCSTESVKKEGYVQREIKRALDIAQEKLEGTIFIIPLKLDECELPRRISRWHWVNLFDEDGYDKLLRSLRHRASKLAG